MIHYIRRIMQSPGSVHRFGLALAIVCGAGALLFGWLLWRMPAAPTVSLDLVEYKQWPADRTRYAELRLSNKTRKVIQYPVVIVRDSIRPRQVPVVCREKVSGVWGKRSGTLNQKNQRSRSTT